MDQLAGNKFNTATLISAVLAAVLLFQFLAPGEARSAVTSKIAAGGDHTVTLKEGGTVWTWGRNSSGQLGIGTSDFYIHNLPVQVQGIVGVISVAAGYSHTVTLKEDGTVWTWGGNNSGQLGDGTTETRTAPVQVTGLSDVIAIDAREHQTVALKSNGTVWQWGSNVITPSQVSGLTGIIAIAAGGTHTVTLKADGTVWTWGNNNSGQLGDGTTISRAIPVQVKDPNSFTGLFTEVTAIAAGSSHTVVLKLDGTVWTWGSNTSGQLGDGTTSNSTIPVQVRGQEAGPMWLTEATAVAAGRYYTIARKGDGTVWTWGGNEYGQLGIGTADYNYHVLPVQVKNPSGSDGLTGVVAIAAGDSHAICLKEDNSLLNWGANSYGMLGDGSNTQRALPVQVIGFRKSPVLAAGGDTMYLLKSDGSVWNISFGGTPSEVEGIAGVTAIASGTSHVLALKDNGTIWTWGFNGYGQLGDGTTTDRFTPEQVPGLADMVAVAAGESHSLALKKDGTVWAWGRNGDGQLGIGTISESPALSPQQVVDPTDPGGFLTGVTAIASGGFHTIAVKNNDQVWSWGRNDYYQLGDGTTSTSAIPVRTKICTGFWMADIIAVAGGAEHSMALKKDGTVWTWGVDNVGQIGDGAGTRLCPDRVLWLSDVAAISAGRFHNAVLSKDGTVRTFGDNSHGQLGDGTTTDRHSPVQVEDPSSPTGWFEECTEIAANYFQTAARKEGGTIWHWGHSTAFLPALLTQAHSDATPPATTAFPPGGTYYGPQTVTLTASEPAVIYYTLDGSAPTTSSATYNGPLTIASTTTLKYFAMDLTTWPGNSEGIKIQDYTILASNPLSININGGGTVNLSAGGSCTTGCTYTVPSGTVVYMAPVPNSGNALSGWGGCDSVLLDQCTVTMNGPKNVTASYEPGTVKLSDNGAVSYYLAVTSAYINVVNGSNVTIYTQAVTLSGNLLFNRSFPVKVVGGYDAGFASRSGMTTVSGSMTIAGTNSTVTVDGLIVR